MCCKVFILFITFNIVWTQVDKCVLSNKKDGVCKPVLECPGAIENIKNFLSPQICNFNGTDPIICCPLSKAAEKCLEYDQTLRDLVKKGLIPRPIIGGTSTDIISYPYMAALGYGDPNNIRWGCGGSLISDKFILTAAHCMRSELGNVDFVRMGFTILSNSFLENKDYKVIKRIRHPEYKPPSVYNDIALLELDRQVYFQLLVQPTCLQTFNSENVKRYEATGWGATDFGKDGSTVLQKVELLPFTYNECNKTYEHSLRRLSQLIQEDKQLCAGGRNEEKDTCQGDSGGPLLLKRDRFLEIRREIVAVTSFGKGCGVTNVPGVYTKVIFYIPWIESIVWQ